MTTRFVTNALLILAAVCEFSRAVEAQNVTVQQPVVQQFGVNTVVSVPDRGSALLGSVGSSGAFSRIYGPLPFGSTVTRSTRHQSVSVNVYIHDFEAMDAALLGQGNPTSPSSLSRQQTKLRPAAHRAAQQLLRDYPSRQNYAATGSSERRFGSDSLR